MTISVGEKRTANDVRFIERRKSRHSRYIANVLRLLRQHRWFFLGTLLAGMALRLFFFVYYPAVTDDSHIYADLATNWLQHGIYGQTQTVQQITQIVPTDTRLPGYPAFLAVMFGLFGVANYRAVLLIQVLLDLLTCLLIADLSRRMISDRAARVAMVLAALCPFLANYAAAALTETLEIFFTVLALDCVVAALDRAEKTGTSVNTLWIATGAALGACILLRPDGGVLLAAVIVYLVFCHGTTPPLSLRNPKSFTTQRHLAATVLVVFFALASLVPWTIRNFHTLHHFQPLAPRYANEVDELAPRGFIRWTKTWIVDYASVEEIYWNVPGDKIDAEKLPSRAFDSGERDATLAIIDEYNRSQQMTPELDARFDSVADQRIHAHPVRYYVVLPLLRAADMWLRPRTEILPPDVRWWEFNDDGKYSALAVGFGLLNLVYLGTALWALDRRLSGIRWAGLLVSFLLLRTALLLTLENPEPRYTLECYPVIILLVAAMVEAIPARRNPTYVQ